MAQRYCRARYWYLIFSVTLSKRNLFLYYRDDPTMSETTNATLVDKEPMDIDVNEQTEKRPSGFVTFDCPESRCTMQFRREDRLRAHLLVGSHRFIDHPCSLLNKSALMYKDDALESDYPKQVPLLSIVNITPRLPASFKNDLKEGWALFSPRKKILFTPAQHAYLNQKYDEGEASGAKWNPIVITHVSLFDLFSNSMIISFFILI